MPTLQNVQHTETHLIRSEKVLAGGSLTELVAGAAAIVLPIVGLAGVLPVSLAAVAFIAIGAALMINGGALGAETPTLLGDFKATGEGARTEFVGGASAEALGGAAVVALGILALVRVAPISLLGVAAVVAGCSMILGAGAGARLGSFRYGTAELSARQRGLLRESVRAASGADVLVGLGGIVLGILVLANAGSVGTLVTLVLVAGLALGGGLFVTGTTTGARMTALLRHA